MAALPSALPAVPKMLGGDDQAKNEYFDALQKTITALEARANQGPNWFQVAGQFLDPGRTGNFGEALGKAASTLGQQQEKQLDMQVPMAKMRAELAGQKYETENQAKAVQLLSSTLGVAPEQVTDILSSGQIPPSAAAKLAQVYPTIARLSPKVGEIVKNTFGMQKDLAGLAAEDRKAGMGQAELVAKYGAGVLNLIPGGGIPTGAGLPASAPQPGPSAPMGTAPAGMDLPVGNQPPVDGIGGRVPGVVTTPVPNAPPMAAARPPAQAPAPTSDLAGLPLAAQAQVAEKRMTEGDKPFTQKRDEILSYTPQLLQSSNSNLRQLDRFATQYPQIFGLMQEQGVLSGLLTAAQEGAQLSAGDFNARAGLPVRQFLEKVKLKPEEQQRVRDVTRILASEFLSNVKANKGLLGVNPTDNDARLLQAPMASIEDSSKAVQLWSRQQLLLNKQREQLYNAYQQHLDTAGPTSSPRLFFRPGSVYEKINNDYSKFRMTLFNQFNPQ
jgi:hypothetical protein